MKTKICNVCNRELPCNSENFHSNGYTPNGAKKWKPKCKSCEKDAMNTSYAEIINCVFPVLECSICGYSKCKMALEFHHVDSSTKEFSIASFRTTHRTREAMIAELKKCVLLCANCHREVHAGITCFPN